MARMTSVLAFEKITQNGLLSLRRLQAYAWLYEHGPATAGEVARGLRQQRNDVASRLAQLRERGVAMEVGVQKDPVTGHENILWDVTDQLPLAIVRGTGPSRKELIKENLELRELLAKALARIQELKAKVQS